MNPSRLVYRVHAIRRMFERRISTADVENVLATGDVIETYPGDRPYPSRLVLGRAGERALHVVAADDPDSGRTVVITVYEPDPQQWDASLRQRKRE